MRSRRTPHESRGPGRRVADRGRHGGDPLAAELERTLLERSPAYFGQPATPYVTLVSERIRDRSELRRFRISFPSAEHHVIAKTTSLERWSPPAGSEAARAPHRPTLGDPTDSDAKHRYEYEALRAVESHLSRGNDERFGIVRALDHLPERRTILIEAVDDPTLRQRLLSAHRLARAPGHAALGEAFARAGSWLEEFHRIPALGERPPLRPTAADAAQALDAYVSFLSRDGRGGTRGLALAARVVGEAHRLLPASLPLGPAHGDFAPRNVFVGAAGRVAVFDILGRWRVPVYEDVAYFTVTLRTTTMQVLSRHLAIDRERMAGYERSFLHGYGGGRPLPQGPLQFFELLVLLDRWAFLTAPETGGRSVRAFLTTGRRRLVLADVRRRVNDLARGLLGS